MPSGFEVYDDSGRLQASDKAYDLNIVSSQTINGATNILKPTIALEGNASNWIFLSLLRGSGQQNIPNIVNGKGIVHVFDYGVTPSSNFGLEVYDEVGKLTFSSNLKSCNVIDFITIPNIHNAYNPSTQLVFDKSYNVQRAAIIPVKIPYYAAINPNDSLFSSLATVDFNTANGRVRASRTVDTVRFLPSGVGFVYPVELVFMVIDVTNF